MARIVGRQVGAVTSHEREVVALLAEQLPDTYRILPNMCLAERAGAQVFEYDIIVVAPHAVYVVEAKAWYGTVTALNRNEWRLSSGHIARNPHLVNDQKARVLASLLKKRSYADRMGSSMREPWVQGCFVAGNDETVLEPLEQDFSRTLTPSALVEYLQTFSQLSCKFFPSPNAYVHLVDEIAEAIYGALEESGERELVFGNYAVFETHDQSDDSATYLARHSQLHDGRVYRVRTWFVSTYRFSGPERSDKALTLRRSADALSRIRGHANVVSVVDFGELDGNFYEVTEWSDRGTLATLISQGGATRLDTGRKLDVLLGIARGLQAAQAAGVFHRDLNPESILLDPDGTPRIADFDRAFLDDASHTVFAATDAPGANAYRPPELRRVEDAEVFDSSDVYSLGVIAFELFTGFYRQNIKEGGQWRPQRLSECVSIPEAIAADLDALVAQMLELDPAARPTRPGEVSERLEALLARLSPNSSLPVSNLSERVEPTPQQNETKPVPVDLTIARKLRGIYEVGEEIAGSNRVTALIGEGSTSRVYEVTNAYTGEVSALKLYDPDAPVERAALAREFDLLREVTHPNVVKVYWSAQVSVSPEAEPLPYLLMERLEGPTLAARLAQGAVDAEQVMGWAECLLGALAAIHDEGLLHRDVKPDNIVLAPRGAVLTDFGAATREPTGSTLDGTVRYTPPDLADAGWAADADLFALGCVLYEALAGCRPWPGAPTSATTPVRLEAQKVPGLDVRTARVITRAIAPHRAQRFTDARAMARALAESLERAPRTQLGRTPQVEGALTQASGSTWSDALVARLIDHEDLLAPLHDTLRAACATSGPPGEDAWLVAEANAMALENPLLELMPVAFDALLVASAPLELGAPSPSRRAPLSCEDATLIVLDGLSHVEVGALTSALDTAGTTRTLGWTARPFDPNAPPAVHDLLEHAFTNLPDEVEHVLPNVLEQRLTEGARALHVILPAGRRGDDGLDALIAQRAAILGALTNAVVARGVPAIVTTTYGSIYLGHGLRRDVGVSSDARGDRIRRQWSATFGAGRCVASSVALEARVDHPTRAHGDLLMVAGRLAWPDPPDAPRLACGGVSLMERLLPAIVFTPS
jgi:serine/threonine protein kinase